MKLYFLKENVGYEYRRYVENREWKCQSVWMWAVFWQRSQIFKCQSQTGNLPLSHLDSGSWMWRSGPKTSSTVTFFLRARLSSSPVEWTTDRHMNLWTLNRSPCIGNIQMILECRGHRLQILSTKLSSFLAWVGLCLVSDPVFGAQKQDGVWFGTSGSPLCLFLQMMWFCWLIQVFSVRLKDTCKTAVRCCRGSQWRKKVELSLGEGVGWSRKRIDWSGLCLQKWGCRSIS